MTKEERVKFDAAFHELAFQVTHYHLYRRKILKKDRPAFDWYLRRGKLAFINRLSKVYRILYDLNKIRGDGAHYNFFASALFYTKRWEKRLKKLEWSEGERVLPFLVKTLNRPYDLIGMGLELGFAGPKDRFKKRKGKWYIQLFRYKLVWPKAFDTKQEAEEAVNALGPICYFTIYKKR